MSELSACNSSDIAAVLARIGVSINSLVGPNRRMKCSVSSDGSSYSMFSDVTSLVDELEITHPVATLFRDFCHSCTLHSASCTSSMAIMICKLAAAVQHLLEQGLPLDDILTSLQECVQLCEAVAHDMAVSIFSLGDVATERKHSPATPSSRSQGKKAKSTSSAPVSPSTALGMAKLGCRTSRHFSTTAPSFDVTSEAVDKGDSIVLPWLRNLCMGVSRQNLGSVLVDCCKSVLSRDDMDDMRILSQRLSTAIIVLPVLGGFGSKPRVVHGLALLVDDTQMESVTTLANSKSPCSLLLVDGDITPTSHGDGYIKSWSSQVFSSLPADEIDTEADSMPTHWMNSIAAVLNKLRVGGVLSTGIVAEEMLDFCQQCRIPVFECDLSTLNAFCATHGCMPAETLLSSSQVNVLSDMDVFIDTVSDNVRRKNSRYHEFTTLHPTACNLVTLKKRVSPWSCNESHTLPRHLTRGKSCTVLMAAATRGHLSLLESAFKSSMKRLRNALACQKVLPGAGLFEMRCIKSLSELNTAPIFGRTRYTEAGDATAGAQAQPCSQVTHGTPSLMATKESSKYVGVLPKVTTDAERDIRVNGHDIDDTRKSIVSSSTYSESSSKLAHRVVVRKKFQKTLVDYLSVLLVNSGEYQPGYDSEREVWRCTIGDMCLTMDTGFDADCMVLDCLNGKIASLSNSIVFLSTIFQCTAVIRTRDI